MMNTKIIVQQLLDHYGRDVFAEAQARMNEMPKEDLVSLVLVACNRMGTIKKGDDYDDELDAAMHVADAIIQVFTAYDNAYLLSQATVKGQEGNA